MRRRRCTVALLGLALVLAGSAGAGQKPYPKSPAEAARLKERGVSWSNAEIRAWYVRVSSGIDALNRRWLAQRKTAAQRARLAYDIRHNARMTARAMMKSWVEVKALQARDLVQYGNPHGPTFQQLVAGARRRGLRGDAAYESIVGSSQRTDAATNERLGVEGAASGP